MRAALESVTPSETYQPSRALLHERMGRIDDHSELRSTGWPKTIPEQVSAAAISRAFGTPKPTLTNSYMPELLNLRTFPTLMGYSSRIMAESWESNLLYYAALSLTRSTRRPRDSMS